MEKTLAEKLRQQVKEAKKAALDEKTRQQEEDAEKYKAEACEQLENDIKKAFDACEKAAQQNKIDTYFHDFHGGNHDKVKGALEKEGFLVVSHWDDGKPIAHDDYMAGNAHWYLHITWS